MGVFFRVSMAADFYNLKKCVFFDLRHFYYSSDKIYHRTHKNANLGKL